MAEMRAQTGGFVWVLLIFGGMLLMFGLGMILLDAAVSPALDHAPQVYDSTEAGQFHDYAEIIWPRGITFAALVLGMIFVIAGADANRGGLRR